MFEEIKMPSKNVLGMIKKYGEPYYVKVDLEHYDHVVLRYLFDNGIFPPYISAESHTIDILCILVALGKYESFKLVDGATVSERYADQLIETSQGGIVYSFPHHSAGPFGNDIHGDWMTKDNFSKVLLFANLGWKDIHATNVDRPNPEHAPLPEFHIQIAMQY
jgi:hypothetical protein